MVSNFGELEWLESKRIEKHKNRLPQPPTSPEFALFYFALLAVTLNSGELEWLESRESAATAAETFQICGFLLRLAGLQLVEELEWLENKK